MNNFVDSKQVNQVLDTLSSRMVSITFIKKDGTVRKLNGQLVDSPDSHKNNPELFTIALSSSGKDKKQFRSANRGTITRIAGMGEVWEVTKD